MVIQKACLGEAEQTCRQRPCSKGNSALSAERKRARTCRPRPCQTEKQKGNSARGSRENGEDTALEAPKKKTELSKKLSQRPHRLLVLRQAHKDGMDRKS